MLPNICNVPLPASPRSIFNELLTQWAKETSVAQQKKSISDLYRLETKREITGVQHGTDSAGCACACCVLIDCLIDK